jgi:uncharacterized protein YciI
MQFLILAYDGTDAGALERRMAARPAHVSLGDQLRDAGKLLFGTAMLDDTGKMIGSMFVAEYDSREEPGHRNSLSFKRAKNVRKLLNLLS